MTIQSMTAFARQTAEGDWGTLTWEIRSVNHRFLEIQLRMPDQLRDMETKIRDIARQLLQRGKVDISLRFQPAAGQASILVNQSLVGQLLNECRELAVDLGDRVHVNAMDILAWPGVLTLVEGPAEEIHSAVQTSFKAVVDQLVAARAREGAALQQFISQRVNSLRVALNELRPQQAQVLQEMRDKLKQRILDAHAPVDDARLNQELVIWAQKADIAEELDRLQSHLDEVGRVLASNEAAIGRRLDFLMQELNREANTLSSKSATASFARVAVDMKVLIEQMREQIQNIE